MCCHTTLDGLLKQVVSCKYLKDMGNGKTTCVKYKTRLNTIIAVKGNVRARCMMRSSAQYDYPGCPQNTGKPDFVEHCRKVMKNV